MPMPMRQHPSDRLLAMIASPLVIVCVALLLVALPSPATATATALAPAQVAGAAIGSCEVSLDPAVRERLVNRSAKPNVVLGSADLQRAKDIEAAADPTRSSSEGMRVRQQLRLADGYLDDALPSRATSNEARASFDRILRLQVAMALAEDGRSPALTAPSTTTAAATYAARIRKEVATFVAMPSWGSTAPLRTGEDEMLDTAEVAAAVSLGYSAAAGTMTSSERGRTRSALLSKALAPACWGWRNGSWMVDATHNWGVVVNAGTAMAALVVADSDVDVAAAALTQSLQRANRAIRAGTSDGGTGEGPSYAGLIQTYTTYLSASMEAAFGPTGPSLVAGIPMAARYLNAVTSPTNQLFSYADSNTGRLVPVLPLWNARRGGDPLGWFLANRVLAESHPHVLLFLWSRPTTATPTSQEPLQTVFPSSGIATMRDGWGRGASFVGIKAGTNRTNHSHLDLGSVVVDMRGHRFVEDPGQDCYCLPGYFGSSQRYSYWRVATVGHSTLTRAGYRQQPLAARAPMSGVVAGSGTRTVAVNMTAATQLRWAQRRVTLKGEDVIVQDQARAWGRSTVRSSLVTRATVTVAPNGRSATMSLGSSVVDVTMPSSTPGVLRVGGAPKAPSGGLSTGGLKTLYVDAPTAVVSGQHAVTVTLVLSPR